MRKIACLLVLIFVSSGCLAMDGSESRVGASRASVFAPLAPLNSREIGAQQKNGCWQFGAFMMECFAALTAPVAVLDQGPRRKKKTKRD